MNMSAECRHGAELDLVAVDQDQAAVMRQGAVRDDELFGGGFAAAGLAADQHVAFGQVDVDGFAVLVGPRCTRSNMENGNVGTGGSGSVPVVVVMADASLRGGWGAAPGHAPGGPPIGLCRRAVLVGKISDEGQGGVVLVVRGQPRQRGGDGVAGRERVAADDVDLDQV